MNDVNHDDAGPGPDAQPDQTPDPGTDAQADQTLPVGADLGRPADTGGGWFRLDRRMVVVHPVKELARFLPALILLTVVGSGSDGFPWQLIGVLVPVTIGLLRYLTTSFRIAEGRVELRTGLVMRRARSARLDRVRTVDLSASLIHRALDLSTVRIGTGTNAEDQDLQLDGLRSAGARRLRDDLLRVAPQSASQAGPSATTDEVEDEADPGADPGAGEPAGPVASGPGPEPVLRLDPRWARYAPLTNTGVLLLLGLLGGGAQLLQSSDAIPLDDPTSLSAPGTSGVLGLLIVLAVVAGLALVLMAVLAVVGYLITNWGFTLRHAGVSWRTSRGLLTTRETTIDDERLAGVRLHEPLSLRLGRAARLSAIVTGLGTGQSSSLLAPPAPARVVSQVAAEVVGSEPAAAGPVDRHGPAATRRRWTRAMVPVLVLVAALLALVLTLDLSGWWLLCAPALLVAACLLAADRARTLGSAHREGYVVARAGSVVRTREVLAEEHVIGWNLRATFWQRRAGLTSLSATTAGGPQSVTVLDIPQDRAIALAHGVLPDLVAQFLDQDGVDRHL